MAVLLRVLLPALHTHAHQYAGPATARASQTTTCSCGALHARNAVDDHREERCTGDGTSPEAQACLACEIEAGTPCTFAPAPSWQGSGVATSTLATAPITDLVVGSVIRLPQPRGPPCDAG